VEIEGLVVASTYNWYGLGDGLMDADYRAHLANPAALQQACRGAPAPGGHQQLKGFRLFKPTNHHVSRSKTHHIRWSGLPRQTSEALAVRHT
jgi:hypothetical protein